MKFYGRVMGAKFADDDEPDPDDAPADIGAKIRQTFAGRIRKGGH